MALENRAVFPQSLTPRRVRYERKHSLSAVHIDWHEWEGTDVKVCVILDDAYFRKGFQAKNAFGSPFRNWS